MSDAPAPGDRRVFRLGTRASKLARWQAAWTAEKLRRQGHAVELVVIRTEGDLNQTGPISAVGGQGVFTKAIQEALLDERVDLAVHSMKDLPTDRVVGLRLAATPTRESAHDALISSRSRSIDELPEGARVGTGSLRRRAQLLALRPDLRVEDLRGNVDTRLRKLEEGNYDAILLALAGLNRLGLASGVAHPIPFQEILPAPAQGALAIECRRNDNEAAAAVLPIEDQATRAAITAERSAMRRLEGGCLAAIGAHATVAGDSLRLSVVVLSEEGARRLVDKRVGGVQQAEKIGVQAANALLFQGAGELLRAR